MAQYKTGTVTVSNGDATVTGSGTLWLAEISVGDWFSLQGQGNLEYQVLSVTSDTALELTTTYAGLSDSTKKYSISRDFTSVHGAPILAEGDVDTHRVVARLATVFDSVIPANLSKATVSTSNATQLTISSLVISNNTVVTFSIQAHGFELATGDTYAIVIQGAIKNLGGVTSLVTGATSDDSYSDTGASTWSIVAEANDATDSLDIKVTGEVAHTISWTSRITYIEG